VSIGVIAGRMEDVGVVREEGDMDGVIVEDEGVRI
jgi:hypothetical protein